jgi:CBS domain-containing protein
MKKMIERFNRPVVTASPNDSLASVARSMAEHNVGAVIITENHRPVGIVTDRDLALALGARGTSPQTPVVRVMTTPVETINQDEGVFAATEAMRTSRARRLPVVDDDGLLVGLVTLDDLLRLLSREPANLQEGIAAELEVR